MLTEELGGLEAAREALARERLEELQALARTYRNWSVKELAHALGRQPGRLVPESGMPKIDLVVGLAKALDWPVDAVVEHLMKPASDGRSAGIRQDKTEDYARLYGDSVAARGVRDYAEAIRLAVRAAAVADTPTRRAAALANESDAHEAHGSYVEAARCLRDAARIDGIAVDWRLLCDAKLANLLFLQGQMTHALGIAASVIEYVQSLNPGFVSRSAHALALRTRGQALRSSIPTQNCEPWRPIATSAREDLRMAGDIARTLAEEPDGNETFSASFAAASDALVLELDAVIAEDAVESSLRGLLAIVRDGGSVEPGVGERKAWAAVALAATARRFVNDEMQRRGILEIASAALRAHAVANSNWYFAHRHLDLDAERRRQIETNGVASRALDAVEAKLVAGVLGQIPSARRDASDFLALYGTREGARP